MLKNAWTIGHVFGIPIRLHITLLLILPLFGWIFGSNIELFAEMLQLDPADLVLGSYTIGFLLGIGLFVSVALHELGHTWMALRRGMNIRSITLLILGGIAEIEDMSKEPADELIIAIMGPAVSLFLGIGCYALGVSALNMVADLRIFLLYLGQMNIVLAVFNLLPAFPSDGGRVLRAFLARRGNYLAATKTATSLGQTMAIIFGILGVFSGNILLLLVAFFLYIAANHEYQTNLLSTTLAGFTVADLMTRDVVSVPAHHTVAQLLAFMYDQKHTGYPVIANGDEVIGCVTMQDVRKVDPGQRDDYRVQDIMASNLHTIEPRADAFEALTKMSQEQIGRLFVFDQDELMGIITRSDIMKGFQLRQIEKRERP